ALAKQKPADVLAAPGEADISALVDFTSLAAAADVQETACFGAVSQRDFLCRLGLESRADVLCQKAPDQAAADATRNDPSRLIGPDQMGELFKALAILPANAPKPPGF